MTDELRKEEDAILMAFQSMSDIIFKNDRAILELCTALTTKVHELNVRIEFLEKKGRMNDKGN